MESGFMDEIEEFDNIVPGDVVHMEAGSIVPGCKLWR